MITTKGDFIEIDYIGKANDQVFDTTSEAEAKKYNVYNPKSKYHPIVICLGHQDIIPGLDSNLISKEIGKSYNVEIDPEQAFGKRNPKLLRLMQTSIFHKHKINPIPGLQVNLDGNIGIIKTVSGGRTIVDFNHPLASKHLSYHVTIIKKITDTKEKVQSILNLVKNNINFELKDKTVTIDEKLSKNLEAKISKEIKNRISEISNVKYTASKPNKE